jgi:ABC-type polysaccharide/polyol phosphate export permease
MATDQLESISRPVSPAARGWPTRRVSALEPRRPGIRAALGELWRHRRYVLFFGHRMLAKRYMRTWLGLAWLPLRPAMNIGAKVLVFGGLVGISPQSTPYAVFFILATAVWQLFSECALWSTRSIDLNRSVLRTAHIPRLTAIVGAVVPGIVDFLINLAFAAVALGYYLAKDHRFYLQVTAVTPFSVAAALLLIAMLGIGIGLLTASAGARARDVRFGLVSALGFMYFLTPIIYPFDKIPPHWRPLAELNPMTGGIELFRAGLFADQVVSPKAVAVTVAAVLVLWIPGLWLFQRNETRTA